MSTGPTGERRGWAATAGAARLDDASPPLARSTAPDLGVALAEVLGRTVVEVRRRPHPSATTATLVEIDADLDAGPGPAGDATVRLLAKDLAPTGAGAARRVAPSFVHDPEREPWVYAHLLGPRRLGVRAVGRWTPPGGDWLLLERIDGLQLRFTDEVAAWAAAGRWLGRFHASTPAPPPGSTPLPVADAGRQARWVERARRFHPDAAGVLDAAERVLADVPVVVSAVVHGDFHASNVLVVAHDEGSPVTVVPVDWEMAALGDPFHDLACLLAGQLPEGLHDAVRRGYAEGAGGLPADVAERLAVAELRAAVQWLGWAPPERWRPPTAQRNPWAVRAAELVAGLVAARRGR